MNRTIPQLLRPLVPNISVRIRHIEPSTRLQVRFREHLGLIVRGTTGYEPQYVAVFKELVRAGNTVFDVGANIGFYSVLFSRWVGPAGKVLAYEPDPANVKLLQHNLTLNGCRNTDACQLALSERT